MHRLPVGTAIYSKLPTPKPILNIPGTDIVSGHPISIKIPSLNINLNVIDGVEDASGQWTLTTQYAQFATITNPANNHSGDTFIYAHDRKNLFINLHLIQPGSTAEISTSNGYTFFYKYTSTYTLKPTDTSIFDYQGAPILTLQTCSGAEFQNRQMFQFSFVNYKKT